MPGFCFSPFYAGCDNVDAIEDYGCQLAKESNAELRYIQPHSGACKSNCILGNLNAKVQVPMLERDGRTNQFFS